MKHLSPLFPKPQDMSHGTALSWIKPTRKDTNPLYRSVCSIALLGGLFALAVEAQPTLADSESDVNVSGSNPLTIDSLSGRGDSVVNGTLNLSNASGTFDGKLTGGSTDLL